MRLNIFQRDPDWILKPATAVPHRYVQEHFHKRTLPLVCFRALQPSEYASRPHCVSVIRAAALPRVGRKSPGRTHHARSVATQHVILTRLIAQRLFLEKIPDREEKRRVFFWLANILLMNFMELRLHALVWNKVVLMVTKDASLERPQVLWNSEQPDEGMAVLIPADLDPYALVDVLYEHVEELELALNERAKRTTSQARRKQQQQNPSQPPRRKKKHYYADEVASLFRKS